MNRAGYTRAVFITIEGPEGAGKTTQAERLAAWFRSRGREVVLVREPGGTELGERLRSLLLARSAAFGITPRADALLFNAARAQLVADVIRPALARGRVVISTRFADSTLAYQGLGMGLPVDELRTIEAFATEGLMPDRTLLLDLPVAEGLGRKTPADVTRFEEHYDLAFHERVRQGFVDLANRFPDRIARVDASGTPDEVFEALLAALGLGAEPDPTTAPLS